MRLFVGVPLSAGVTHELSAISQRLQSGAGGLRWMTPDSWHITLQFLGSCSDEQYECTVAGLRAIHLPPVSITLDALGVFDRAGIVFAGVTVAPQLLQLQERVTAATEPCGFVAETRPYQPHITLARSKGKGPHPHLNELHTIINRQPKFSGFVAHEFLLYESFLGPAGSRYEVRQRFPLKDL